MLRVIINGMNFDFEDRLSVLDAARRAGIDGPTICFDPRFDPLGTCRLCCVEIEGQPHPQIACRTPLRDGMRIATHTPALGAFRHTMLGWLAAHVTSRLWRQPRSPIRNLRFLCF